MTCRAALAVSALVVALAVAGVAWRTVPRSVPVPEAAPAAVDDPLPGGVRIAFRDVTSASGADFRHFDGRTPMQYIMDQTGSGLAWLDYDQDGLMDLFLVQGSTFEPPHPDPPVTCRLFRNLGGGRFADVTAAAGPAHVGCGQGVAVGDYDNDGYPDLFVTCFGKPNALYHNVSDGKGGRRFVEVTREAGLADHPDWKGRPNYSTSAAFLDFDNDGLLDLFVCSYLSVDRTHYPNCRDRRGRRDACPPSAFEPTRCLLYRNNGDGTFTEVGRAAGVDLPGKALGVVALDLDGDGRTDLFVANDGMPNFLLRNRGDGRFESLGPSSGCAFNLDGATQAYMGVDADDLHGDGWPDLYVTAFAREPDTLFCNLGNGCFLDATRGSGIGPSSWHPLSWGVCLFDADRDGRLDVAVANGHVSRHIDDDGNPNNTFRQPAQFYWNEGGGRFRHLSGQVGAYFREPRAGRGLAACDFDNDGLMDLAFNNSGESAVLLRNESTTPYHWLRLHLRGTKSNRDAVGARVTVEAGGRRLVRHRKGGGSYCSASDPRLLIGLGAATRAERVEVRWPSGLVQQFGPLSADRGYVLVEGGGAAEAP
jgi:hypothetical protein